MALFLDIFIDYVSGGRTFSVIQVQAICIIGVLLTSSQVCCDCERYSPRGIEDEGGDAEF